MAESFPRSPQPKRRKTKGRSIMKPKQVPWPMRLLPTEIYEAIIAYLPRSDVQNMRLVNKEFDQKICAALFTVVVVPFRPEIYGISSEAQNAKAPSSVMLQDQGMRVFAGFGHRIRRFAMSFEIDMYKLANPPVKSDQEAIASFWGTYRWPYQNYNRYTQLEGLEQTADETRSMAKALRYITQAQELGLSIDGGLGWLPGPDTNQRVVDRAKKLRVFGDSKFVSEPKQKPGVKSKSGSLADTYSNFERLLQEAGYRGDNLDPSTQLLLGSDEIDTQNDRGPWNFRHQRPQVVEEAYALWRRRRPRMDYPNTVDRSVDAASLNDDGSDADDGTVLPVNVTTSISNRTTVKLKDIVPLKPNDLTTPQKEMLLEMEWAQNAFMQSWVIAIVDNRSTFEHIRTLNIARLPNRHLPILSRKDFWNSLSGLEKLSLAVIPDWRDVKKDETTWVVDQRMTPSSSIASVYQIFAEHIASRRNITTLHFEWLCGGEYSPGLFSRNQLILAAPVVAQVGHMVGRLEHHGIISLPHVKHLSFKNCWFAPHVLTRFLWSLKKEALESIKFDSVSLTAAIPLRAQPGALLNPGNNLANAINNPGVPAIQAANGMAALFAQGNNVNVPQLPPANLPVAPMVAPVVNNFNEPPWLQQPRAGSWVDVIESVTPGRTMAQIRYDRNIGPEPTPFTPSKLCKLTFTSCGYVRLPMDFDQQALGNPASPTNLQLGNTPKRTSDIESFMMKPLDHYLGTINNHIPAIEAAALENAWAFNVSWPTARPEFEEWADLVDDCHLDGAINAGVGRFMGVIEVASVAPEVPESKF